MLKESQKDEQTEEEIKKKKILRAPKENAFLKRHRIRGNKNDVRKCKQDQNRNKKEQE